MLSDYEQSWELRTEGQKIPFGRLRVLLCQSQTTYLKPGEVLFEQDDEADALYLVRSGALEVSMLSIDGRKHTLNVLKKGELFGEIAMLDGGTRTATIGAIRPTRLMKITRSNLLNNLTQHPELSMSLLSLTTRRLRWFLAAQETLSFQPLEVRLARRLQYLIETLANANGELSMSQSDLADHVGATREATSKCLAEWQKRGIVELGRRRIRLTNNHALTHISEAM